MPVFQRATSTPVIPIQINLPVPQQQPVSLPSPVKQPVSQQGLGGDFNVGVQAKSSPSATNPSPSRRSFVLPI